MNNKILETACDLVLDDLYAQLSTLQITYKDEELTEDVFDDKGVKTGTKTYPRGEYFQGLLTPPTIPKDGELIPFDKTIKAKNLKEDYSGIGLVLPASSPCAIRIDVYEDDNGWGWTLTGTVEDAGEVYERTINFGHLEDRASNGWEKLQNG